MFSDQRFSALEDLMLSRRAVRGFLPRPVPRADIERVLALAGRAPSGCNAQPWVVHIVSGEIARRVATKLHEYFSANGSFHPDYPMNDGYPGVYRIRQIESAKALFAATGIARNDTAARTASFLRNFQFFDAPHAAFIFLPAWAGMHEAADCGMFAQSLMLAMVATGLASCPQGALSYHGPMVRSELGIGQDLRLLFGLSFGYEDVVHPANTTRTGRAALVDTTVFHDLQPDQSN